MTLALGSILVFAPASAIAGPAAQVNAESFYTTAVALKKKGVLARFDKRFKPTFAQMKDAGKKARAANEAATKRGAPLYCVPAAARKKGLNVDKLIAMLGALGKAKRQSMNLEAGWLEALKKQYPC